MIIQKRSMNWLPKVSAFEQAQQQAERRRSAAQAYLSQQANLAGALMGTTSDSGAAAVKLAIDIAVKRITGRKQA